MGNLPERVVWDEDGNYEAALIRLARANDRGKGCTLTPAMVQAMAFEQGDGSYWQSLLVALHPIDSRAE